MTTGITRFQAMDIDVGLRSPLHFVVPGDLHLAIDGIFLHRTVKLPPGHENGVTTEAAFLAFCAESRLIDAVKIGCELLRLGRLDLTLLHELLTEESWRRGAAETTYVMPFLDARCRSMPEAELLTYVACAGLPAPAVNETIELAPGVPVTPDLWFVDLEQAVEYEGSQHQGDRDQYNADIDRYSAYRRHEVAYELITKERMRSPKATIRLIHRALARRGHDGAPPDFGLQWDALFEPVRRLVRPRRPRPQR